MGPYKFVNYEHTTRDEFQVNSGHHPFDSLYIIQSGEFISKSDGVTNTYKSGDVIFFPAEMEFKRYILKPLVFHFIWLTQNPDSEFKFVLPTGKLVFKDNKRLQSTLQSFSCTSLISSVTADFHQHLLDDIIYQYYIETQLAFNGNGYYREVDDTVLVDIINYMKDNISQKLNLQQLSQRFGITGSGLIWKFKNKLNSTPIEYFISMRIQLAKHLLSETDMSLQKIAVQCGFDNVYYFSNIFKKRLGVSPSVYRKSLL